MHKKALELIRNSIFTIIKDGGTWKDKQIYYPSFDDKKEYNITIGYPYFIIAEGNNARWSTLEETMEWINEQSDEDE